MQLQGKIIINTQQKGQNNKLNQLLQDAGAKVVSFPCIETTTVIPATEIIAVMQKLADFDWLVFTSKNGVTSFFEILEKSNREMNLPKRLKIASIGKKTSSELMRYDVNPHFVNLGNTSTDFIHDFVPIVQNGEKILLALGNLAPDKIKLALARKADIIRIDVYETICPKIINQQIVNNIENENFDLAVFTSPSSFYNFQKLTNIKKEFKIASIGDVTTKAIETLGFQVAITSPISLVENLANEIVNQLNN